MSFHQGFEGLPQFGDRATNAFAAANDAKQLALHGLLRDPESLGDLALRQRLEEVSFDQPPLFRGKRDGQDFAHAPLPFGRLVPPVLAIVR